MWNDSNDEIMDLLDSLDDLSVKAPYECPICKQKEGHLFFYRNNDSKFGSSWQWCSNCKNYSHVRIVVPYWWKNMESIDKQCLEAEPEYLENIKKILDAWINKLKK